MQFIGWLGVFWGLLVAPPQLWKIIKTGKCGDISLWTYSFLFLAIACYLAYSISIGDPVFITAQSINLTTNSVILWFLVRDRRNSANQKGCTDNGITMRGGGGRRWLKRDYLLAEADGVARSLRKLGEQGEYQLLVIGEQKEGGGASKSAMASIPRKIYSLLDLLQIGVPRKCGSISMSTA